MAHDRFFLGRPFVLNPKFTTETVEKITTVLRATGYDFFAKKLRLIIFLIEISPVHVLIKNCIE